MGLAEVYAEMGGGLDAMVTAPSRRQHPPSHVWPGPVSSVSYQEPDSNKLNCQAPELKLKFKGTNFGMSLKHLND